MERRLVELFLIKFLVLIHTYKFKIFGMMKKQKRYSMYGPDIFYNFPFGKSDFKKLVHNITILFSQNEALNLLELIKSLGFQTSTRASFSISLEDVKEVPIHNNIVKSTSALIHSTERQFMVGQISESERFQQSIDLWNNVTSYLRTEILIAFQGVNRLNSIYMMAFSGARGNLNQVRQLVALRGLIADPLGRVLDVPIRSNLNEGLSLTEYLISCYGSRKGVVDTAIRTAQAGYLTRRLIEVGQLILIRAYDCQTLDFIVLRPLNDSQGKTIVPLYARSLGRTLAKDVEVLELKKNEVVGWRSQYLIKQSNLLEISVRSPLSCENLNGVCQRCYGWNLSNYDIVTLGEAVGVLAAQAIGEPGTQLTMRTFHTGGAFSGEASDFILAPRTGIVRYIVQPKGYFVHTRWGNIALFTQTNGVMTIDSKKRIDIPANTILFVREGSPVIQGQVLGERLAHFTSEDILQSTQERQIYSFCDGQIVYNHHLLTDYQKYQGMSIVQGSYIGKHLMINRQFGGWFSIGDHFYNFTFFNPIFYRANQTGLVMSNITKRKVKKYFSYTYETVSTGLLLPSYSTKFYLNSLTKISKILWSEYKHYFSQHLTYLFANQSNILAWSTNNFINIEFESSVHSSILNSRFGNPKTFILSFVYLYKLCLNISLIMSDIQIKGFPDENILEKYLKKWRLHNPTTNLSYLNYFIPGYSGIVCMQQTKAFNSISKFRFQNLLYPFQDYLIADEIQYNQGWVFKTRKPLYRISGWITCLPNTLYLKPFSVTLNLKSIKSVKWSLFKSFETILYPSVHYRTKIFNNQAKVIMPRLFGYEFPEHQLDYYSILLNSRFYLGICFKYFNYLTKNLTLSDSSEKTFSFKKNFPEIQFYFLAFQNQLNLKVSKIRNPCLARSNPNWYSLFKFQTYFNILNLKSSRIESLLIYGKTLTLGTPIMWVSPLSFNGGEVNFYKKTINLINNNHILSYSKIKNKNGNYFSLGSLFYMGKNYESEHSPSNGVLFDHTETNFTFRKAEILTTPITENFFVKDGQSIQEGQLLTTFQVQRASVSDITQGLPRVEKILEGRRLIRRLLARKWASLLRRPILDNFEFPPNRYNLAYASQSYAYFLFFTTLKNCKSYKDINFKSSLLAQLNLAQSILKNIQELVLNEVQLVYKNQGVQIADKHIEIILRNLTTRIQVIEGGNTTFLPGELVYPQHFYFLISALSQSPGFFQKPIKIKPIFVGLSASGRGSSSFLAASSFQNTRKVLSATVVNGSSDWLRGLKSHVILGSSVPVGTGTAFTLKFPMPIAFLYTQWHIIHLDLKHLELDLVELDNAD